MKQNITLALDKTLLKRARALAASQGASVSGLLTAELRRIVDRGEAYQRAKPSAVAHLAAPFHSGGEGVRDREALHDRQGLR